MIAIKLTKPKGGDGILLVLEPGNISKLMRGQPIVKMLNEFFPGLDIELSLAFTPDADWVAQQLQTGADLGETLAESLSRPHIVRGNKDAEELKKAEPIRASPESGIER